MGIIMYIGERRKVRRPVGLKRLATRKQTQQLANRRETMTAKEGGDGRVLNSKYEIVRDM